MIVQHNFIELSRRKSLHTDMKLLCNILGEIVSPSEARERQVDFEKLVSLTSLESKPTITYGILKNVSSNSSDNLHFYSSLVLYFYWKIHF